MIVQLHGIRDGDFVKLKGAMRRSLLIILCSLVVAGCLPPNVPGVPAAGPGRGPAAADQSDLDQQPNDDRVQPIEHDDKKPGNRTILGSDGR